MRSIIQKRWLWGLMVFFAIAITIIAVTPYLTFNRENFSEIFDGRFPDLSVMWIYVHVISGGIALAVGPFQFWKWLRNKHRNIHRWLGRFYFFAGIFPASLSGLVLAPGTPAGWSGALGFGLLGIFWFSTGAMALYAILNKDVQTHRRWMIRNFSLTMAAVTLRLWIPILIFAQVPLGVDPEQFFANAYQLVPWLSWIPNLMVAEMIINALMPQKQMGQGQLLTES